MLYSEKNILGTVLTFCELMCNVIIIFIKISVQLYWDVTDIKHCVSLRCINWSDPSVCINIFQTVYHDKAS